MLSLTDSQLLLVITTAGTFVASTSTLVLAALKAHQQRQQAFDDRAAASEDRAAATREIIARATAEGEALKIKTEAIAAAVLIEAKAAAAAAALQVQTDNRRIEKALEAKIDQVHVAAAGAFTEANHVKETIADLNKRLVEQGDRAAANTAAAALAGGRRTSDPHPTVITQQLETIQTTTEAIDHKVDAIKDATTDPAANKVPK